MKRPLVYVCSRYSGDIAGNVEKARAYCRCAVEMGAVPVAPHLFFPQFIKEETERKLAMRLALELLKRCDEVWVFDVEAGLSEGMSAEFEAASANGKVVRFFTKEMEEIQ